VAAVEKFPHFTNSIYNTTLPESSPLESFVVGVSASDLDPGMNSKMTYSLSLDTSSTFHIDPYSGVVTTLARLDRESREFFEFEV